MRAQTQPIPSFSACKRFESVERVFRMDTNISKQLTLSSKVFESVESVKAYGFHPPTLLLYARKQASPLGGA